MHENNTPSVKKGESKNQDRRLQAVPIIIISKQRVQVFKTYMNRELLYQM